MSSLAQQNMIKSQGDLRKLDTEIEKKILAETQKKSKYEPAPFSQLVYINLPGQEFNWTPTSSRLEVLLTRHRDVIIDINAPTPVKNLTLKSTGDAFYDPKTNKQVKELSVINGQRSHVWLSREHKGDLVLMSSAVNTQARFKIEQLFATEHAASFFKNPNYKPEPLMLVVGESGGTAFAQNSANETMYIVEMLTKAPASIEKLADGETFSADNTEVKIWLQQNGIDLDKMGIGLDGTVAVWNDKGYLKDAMKDRVSNSNKLTGTKFTIKKVAGKLNIVFKGYAGLRSEMPMTHTLANTRNTKVLRLTGGATSVGATSRAAWDAAKSSYKGLGTLSVVFVITVDVATWMQNSKADLIDLASKVGIDLLKIGITAALASTLLSIGLSILTLAGIVVSAPVALVVVGTIVFGIWLGSEVVDPIFIKIEVEKKLNEQLRLAHKFLKEKSPKDYPVDLVNATFWAGA